MANFINDLGSMIVAAINGNAAAFSALGTTGATVHASYGSQDDEFNAGQSGKALVTYDTCETPPETDFETEAISTFRYLIWFDLVDPLDKDKSVAVIQQAMRSVFRERGKNVLDSYLTDSGPNRSGKGGEITYTLDFIPPAEDEDEPQVLARVAITIAHVQPLL